MSEPQVLLAGLVLGESPRWHDDRLWVADWGAQQLVAVDQDGDSEVVMDVASFPFCFDFLPDGRLLVVNSSEGRLVRREPDGTVVTHADLDALSDKPWNDIVVDARGNAYVNNIGFDFPDGEVVPGTIALVTRDGDARQVAGDVAFPNGMAVTPDGATLVVAESYGARLTAFDIDADGSLSGQRLWAELPDGAAPDGICIDAEGAIWYADVPNQLCVRVREGGEVVQTVDLDRGGFACMLGGADRRTLFAVTAEWPAAMDPTGPRTGQVVTVPVSVPGAGFP